MTVLRESPDIQNIPFDVDANDPEVIRKLIDITKQTLAKITILRQQVDEITDKLS